MAFKPDPDFQNLWVYDCSIKDNNKVTGIFESSKDFFYDAFMDYVFIFDGWASLGPQRTLKDVNQKCKLSYEQNKFVLMNNDGLFKFKKGISTTNSLNTYELLKWFTQANLRRPPLAANIFAIAAAVQLNTNLVYNTPLQFNKRLYTYITQILEAADQQESYIFKVQSPTGKTYYKQWNIKQLLTATIDEKETFLPVICLDDPFFELKIARIMRIEISLPTTITEHSTYLVNDNGQRLTPAEEAIYTNRQMFIDNDELQTNFYKVHEKQTATKMHCFYAINKDSYNTQKAFFVLFRSGDSFRMAYLN
jgi:hypothetical protein